MSTLSISPASCASSRDLLGCKLQARACCHVAHVPSTGTNEKPEKSSVPSKPWQNPRNAVTPDAPRQRAEARRCLKSASPQLLGVLTSRILDTAFAVQTQPMWKLTSPTSTVAAHRLACHCTTTAQQSTASLASKGRPDASFGRSSLRLPSSWPNRTLGGHLSRSDHLPTLCTVD